MRLIDISPLIKAQDICEDMECRDCELEVRDCESMMDLLMKMPTIDAVQVVRCKDCIHRPKGTGANHDLEFPDYVCPCQCDDYYYSWIPKDDWFCKDGERKEE